MPEPMAGATHCNGTTGKSPHEGDLPAVLPAPHCRRLPCPQRETCGHLSLWQWRPPSVPPQMHAPSANTAAPSPNARHTGAKGEKGGLFHWERVCSGATRLLGSVLGRRCSPRRGLRNCLCELKKQACVFPTALLRLAFLPCYSPP